VPSPSTTRRSPGAALRRLLLPLLMSLARALPGGGQAASSSYANWEAFTSMGRVEAVCLASSGVWCATAGGVLRYDPVQRQYQRLTRLDGLAGNRVTSVAAGWDGDVWCGTDGDGLSRWVASAGAFAPPVEVFDGYRVSGLLPHAGRLYAVTGAGISALEVASGRVLETYRQFGSYSRGVEVLALTVHAGDLWVGTAEGAARAPLSSTNLQDPEAWTVAAPLRQVASFAAVGPDLYCGSSQGVYRWDRDQRRWVYAGPGGVVRALGVSDGTLAAIDARGTLQVRQSSGLWVQQPLATTADLLCLSSGGDDLWIGTSRGPVPVNGASPPALQDPPGNHFYDLASDGQGGVWAASVPDDRTTDPFGVYHFDGASWSAFGRGSGLPSDYAVAVEVDGDGNVWVGTWAHGAAVRGPDGAWRRLDRTNSVLRGITAPPAPDFVAISGAALDGAGNMWLANVQAGLAVMDGHPPARARLHGLDLLGLPPGTDLGPLAVADDGLKLAATTDRGLVIYEAGATPLETDGARVAALNTASEPRLSSDRVTALLAHGKVLWIGTDNGLHRVPYEYSPGTGGFRVTGWRQYRLEHGLPSTDVTSLTRDGQGDLWVGTRGGLAQIRDTGLLVQAYTASNSGLIADRVESVLYDADQGWLWIGTYDGLGRLRLSVPSQGEQREALVYPNPFHPGRDRRLTFGRLPVGTGLRLYSADGALVRVVPAGAGGADPQWDGTNAAGAPVASGVYYYTTFGPPPGQRGRFAVVAHD